MWSVVYAEVCMWYVRVCVCVGAMWGRCNPKNRLGQIITWQQEECLLLHKS